MQNSEDQVTQSTSASVPSSERIGALLRWAIRDGSGTWKARAVLAVAGAYLVGIFAILLTLIWSLLF